VTAKGYASQTDAAYWALRVLLEFPDIGRALAKRFPEIIIDEAQDTSEAQMRVLDRLCELGLTELMLVGDPDQAIFEWRDAKPEILMAKTQGSLGWGQPLSLRENRRSSQIICNTIIGFSQCRCDGMRAVGDHCNSTILPLLIEYSPSNLGALVDALRSACNCYGLPVSPTTAAILVRGNDLLKQILGFADGLDDWKEPWKDNASSLVARAAFRFSHDQDIGRSMSLLEHALARICFKDRHFTESELRALVCEKIGERQWRSGLYALLKHLPPTDLALRDWVIQTSNLLVTRLVSLGWPVPNSKRCSIEHKKRLPGVRGLAQLPVTSFFRQSTATTDDITVETIHAAKGKTYEAVLYVVSPGQKKGSSGKRVPG